MKQSKTRSSKSIRIKQRKTQLLDECSASAWQALAKHSLSCFSCCLKLNCVVLFDSIAFHPNSLIVGVCRWCVHSKWWLLLLHFHRPVCVSACLLWACLQATSFVSSWLRGSAGQMHLGNRLVQVWLPAKPLPSLLQQATPSGTLEGSTSLVSFLRGPENPARSETSSKRLGRTSLAKRLAGKKVLNHSNLATAWQERA